MKLSKAFSLLLLSSTALASIFKSEILDSWDVNDLKNYLSDNSISYDEKKVTVEQLKDLSRKQWELQNKQKKESWYHPENLKQKVVRLYNKGADSLPSTTSLVDYSNLKDWVFTTWSAKELGKLLKNAGIKYESGATRSDLLKLAQKNYDKIAGHYKASGKYPGDWLYSSWDKKDLKKWLKDYGVDYSTLKDSKADLVRKVRENAWRASQYTQDERDSVLESVDLPSLSLFDKAGSVKEEVFGAWTASQLYKWLKSHKIDVDESAKNNKETLASTAMKYKDDLKSDIDYWTKKASEKASPLLHKGGKKADNLVNDTFFVGIESWSRDRLKAFLEARGVSIPLFATKYELVELVKANKYKPIKNFNSEWFFEGWSKDNIQKWVQEQGDAASQGSKDLWASANDYYKAFVESLTHYASKASDTASVAYDAASGHASDAAAKVSKMTQSEPKSRKDMFFDYWSDVELKKYLATFGIYNTKTTKREELLDLAKKNTMWFVGGAKDETNGVVASTKLATLNTYNYLVMYFKNWYNRLYFSLFGKV